MTAREQTASEGHSLGSTQLSLGSAQLSTGRASCRHQLTASHRRQSARLTGGSPEHRLARRLTQANLADQCGLHRTFIGSVERGERNVSILNLRQIVRALRVPLAMLLDESSAVR